MSIQLIIDNEDNNNNIEKWVCELCEKDVVTPDNLRVFAELVYGMGMKEGKRMVAKNVIDFIGR